MKKPLAYVIIFLALILSGFLSYSYFSKNSTFLSSLNNYKPPQEGGLAPTIPNEPKTEECPLNGEMLTKTQKTTWEKRRPLLVMIENHEDARPQSGISFADI